MKRAWPYALALAVVVTGCYLALAPLLRSLSPAPSGTATSQLSRESNTLTIGKQTDTTKVVYNSPTTGKQQYVSGLTTKKAKKKAKKPVTAAKTPSTTTRSTGFAGNTPSSGSSTSSPSTSSSSTPSSSTPKTPAKAPTKTTPRKGSSVGGDVVQSPNGDSGLAGGNSSGTSDLGQKPDVGG